MTTTVEVVWMDDSNATYEDIEQVLTSDDGSSVTLTLPNGAYAVIYTHGIRYIETSGEDTICTQ